MSMESEIAMDNYYCEFNLIDVQCMCTVLMHMILYSRMSLIRTLLNQTCQLTEHQIESCHAHDVTATPMKCYCHARFAVHVIDLGYANKASNRKKLISPASSC